MRSPNFGGVRGIRTLGTLLTYTRFPVVLVMTASIPLHMLLSAAVTPASAGTWSGVHARVLYNDFTSLSTVIFKIELKFRYGLPLWPAYFITQASGFPEGRPSRR